MWIPSSAWNRMVAVSACLLLWACSNVRQEGQVSFESGRFTLDWPHESSLNAEARTSFERQVERDVGLLAAKLQDAAIIEALRESNARTSELSLEAILQLDHRWINAEPDDPFIAEQINEECSQVLIRFQQTFREFAEIFVTDRNGLNVCQTNKTTDYYQADEQWWLDTHQAVSAGATHGPLEYDLSAKTYAIPVFVAIARPDTGELIGVGKGVVKSAPGR